jgi:limonene-1,2-epoxide hydrolase
MTRAQAVELFDRRCAAWLREDLDAYLAMWAEEMTFQSPVHPVPVRGRAAFAQLVRQSMQMMRPLVFDVHHLAVHGNVILAEWTIAAEHRQSGQRVEWAGMSVAEVADGVITGWREYWNPADLAPMRRVS